jgi:hypothetical protein
VVAGEGDGVTEDVARGGATQFDAQAGAGEAVEEVGFGASCCQRLADRGAELVSRCLGTAGAFGFATFGGGGALVGRAIARIEAAQSELLLQRAAGGLALGQSRSIRARRRSPRTRVAAM